MTGVYETGKKNTNHKNHIIILKNYNIIKTNQQMHHENFKVK